mmetsp:Transcript_31810/g.61564  ORF Transcript_31810/g.61564 Transcript_31810/m.61564 type:complete len:126 (+) Transcript_31810:1808-2185(+)
MDFLSKGHAYLALACTAMTATKHRKATVAKLQWIFRVTSCPAETVRVAMASHQTRPVAFLAKSRTVAFVETHNVATIANLVTLRQVPGMGLPRPKGACLAQNIAPVASCWAVASATLNAATSAIV